METRTEGPAVSAADYVKALQATLATLAILVVQMRALGKQFSDTLTSQLDLKQEILGRTRKALGSVDLPHASGVAARLLNRAAPGQRSTTRSPAGCAEQMSSSLSPGASSGGVS